MIVGSGLMVPCLVSTLQSLNFDISVLGNVQSELDSLSHTFNIPTFPADVTSPNLLLPMIENKSVVISMVPPRFHHYVLQACIEAKVNLVTPSYVSQDMLALESAAKEAGIVVINENGLDPGIDHMSVVVKLQKIREMNGRLIEFQSSCGAFPAPEDCSNKLCYKLAWAPYGALLAAIRPARYLQDNEMIEIEGKDLMNSAKPYDLEFPIPLVHYPNGDSSIYPEKYGITDTSTVIRSTLRPRNYPIICSALATLGIYNEAPQTFPSELTWKALTSELAGETISELTEIPENIEADLAKRLAGKFSYQNTPDISLILSAFVELGLFSDTNVNGKSIFDAYVNLVSKSLEYKSGERDCVIMEHKFLVGFNDKSVRYRSRIIEYGVPNGGTSAVSRLVSVPTALAADWICKNKHAPGFMYPVELNYCQDILNTLEHSFNVRFEEEEETVEVSSN